MISIIKKIASNALSLFLSPLKLFVPMGNVVLFGTYSRKVYRENTKYIYEHMSQNTDHFVYWITGSPEIKSHIINKGFKCLYTKNILQKAWLTLRARVVVDSGTGYFNFLNLLHRKAIRICTNHGNSPKSVAYTFEDINETLKYIKIMNKFDYVNYPSNYAGLKLGVHSFKLPRKKIVNLGYPRCDQYFNKNIVNEAYKNKSWLKKIISDYDSNARVLFYTPTWRPYSYPFPLYMMEDMDFVKFNDFLATNNMYFLYTLHSLNEPKSLPDGFDRIIRIKTAIFPFFDTNEFMLEVDILINDYSTTSLEISLIDRPQIFFMPDYDQYSQFPGFADDYKSYLTGDEVFDFAQFQQKILEVASTGASYVSRFDEIKDSLLRKYYDVQNKNASQLFSNFISTILG